MSFQDNLTKMPSIDHLRGMDIMDSQGQVVHHIPAQAGKMGSLRVYFSLAQEFNQRLDTHAAEHGLWLFAEHVADTLAHPGKHPNVEFLLRVRDENLSFTLQPLV